MGVHMKAWRQVALIFLVALVCSCTEDQRAWLGHFFKAGKGSAVPVVVEQMVAQERQGMVIVPAVLRPSDRVEVTLPDEAHIEKVFVNVGDGVKQGTLLCRLSEEDVGLKLASLRAELREAQANLEKNQYFSRNRDRLLEEGRIDRNQYDNLDSEVNGNEAAVDRLRADIAQLEAQTTNVNVTSPIAGIVQAKYAGPGLVIQEKQPLFVITKIDPISVVFALAPYEAKTVRPDMPVTVRFVELPGEAVTAAVKSVGTAINQETGRFDVTAQIPNPNGTYKVGMAAQVEFAGAETEKYFSVPAEAVITDARRHYVFTVSNGLAHKVPVVVREIKNDYAEIIEGLMEGNLVVVKGNKQLKEGSVVDIWGR
jgi:RND family efflux transporter MFP subunit